MITVVDIQTNNAYSYGEENGFDRRVFIIYDGIHYDGKPVCTPGTGVGLFALAFLFICQFALAR